MKYMALLSLTLTSNIAWSEVKVDADENTKAKNSDKLEYIQIIGRTDELRTESGSSTLIDELTLKKLKYDDIHRILANVPGVNIRQEDGYGLRPNIGFRGVTPERSKKINILEDGVLIGPAPYSAPAAYYFPVATKFNSIEVFKGPAAIKYGPNTVAGTLNMATRAIPEYTEAMLDLSIGSNGYNKLHSYWGTSVIHENGNQSGVLIEGLTMSADGFKTIDNGSDSLFSDNSGFDKNDLLIKLDHQLSASWFGIDTSQLLEFKWSQANEDSNETYLGLTDSDFATTPYRRYAASQVGNMDWNHEQVQFAWHIKSDHTKVSTRIYDHTFARAWRKVNGFVKTNNPGTDRNLQDVIANPTEEINQELYAVLVGQQDSDALYKQLVVGTNDRSYYSKGIQVDAQHKLSLFGVSQILSSGIRLHEDQILRDHFEQNYLMQSGVMTPDQLGTYFTTVNQETATATSFYIEDKLLLGSLELSLGSRLENIDSRYQNRSEGQQEDWLAKETSTWLNSLSAFYKVSEKLGLFAGVHEGYVPTSPKQAPSIQPERSTNYELGARLKDGMTQFESVLFLNDFSNLKESCSFSTSASCTSEGLVDKEYNGGEVEVYGLETNASTRFALTRSIDFPVSLTYTYTNSEFKSDINSSFELWGDIEAGDPVPYLADHQLTLNLGLESTKWQVNLLVKYVGEMHEAAGDNVPLSGLKTDEYTIFDLTASYDLTPSHNVYIKVDNLTDEVALVSRRPFGARPGKPQQFFVGYRYQF